MSHRMTWWDDDDEPCSRCGMNRRRCIGQSGRDRMVAFVAMLLFLASATVVVAAVWWLL
jgi:hypothetical protein